MSAMERAIQSLCLVLSVMGGVVARAPALADSVPFWGAKASVPIDTPISQLKKGEFLWMGEAVTTGPVVMVVSITEQRGYVYRNGILIGATTVSTGRPGHLTPTGVFTVLQKQKEHRSTIYDGAPMPYMERLTWGGVALHAGGLPGYPESHGCIHLPSEFAQRLFDISPNGMTVVIGSEQTAPRQVAHPGYLAPVRFAGGQPVEPEAFAPKEDEHWQPELSPSGPDPYVPDPTKFSWLRIGVPGHLGEQGTQVDPNAVARIKMPGDFAARINGILAPGATLFVTDEALYPQTSGPMLQVVDADPPAKRP